jgi:thiosulfate dehydrogenase
MGKFLVGLVAGLILFPALAAVYLLSGFAPAAVADHPLPFERIIAGGALEARIKREAPKRDLSSFSEADILAGAQAYRRSCAGCHGFPPSQDTAPGPPRPSRVMFPPPPQLFTPDGYVTDDPLGVTYWKIVNGIRLSGMPSFKAVLTDDQAWQIAALVGSADIKLPPEVLDELKPGPPPGAPPAAGAPNPAPTQVKPTK